VDTRWLIAVGWALSGVSLLWMTDFYLDVSFGHMMWLRVLQGAGLAFLFVPINTLAFRDVPPEKTNNASALVNLARNLGGSIGISVMSTLLTRREQFHQSRLVESLQSLNPAYPHYASQMGNLFGGGPDIMTTLAGIYQQAVQQATLLSYLDDFKILGVMSLALLPLLLLVKPGKGGGAAVPVH
jgi:DHA2 family multidrug resistance protein